jgi:hypothetical protein
VYGLTFAYMEKGDIEQAQKHFQMVLDIPAPEELRTLARNGLRMDAVFYLLDAMRLFSGKSLDEVREVAFEIVFRDSTVWTSTTPRRPMSCGRCLGGTSRRGNCCASCTPASIA